MALCATRHQRTKQSRTPSSRNFSVLAPTARVYSNPKCTHRLDSPLITSASMGLLVAVVPAVGSVRMTLRASRHQRTKPSRTPSSRNFPVLAPTARVDSNPKCTHRLDSPLMTSMSMGLLVAVVLTLGGVQMALCATRHQRTKPSRTPSSRNFGARADGSS